MTDVVVQSAAAGNFSTPAADSKKAPNCTATAHARRDPSVLRIEICADLICDVLSRCSRFTVIACFDKCAYLKPLDGFQHGDRRTLICLCQRALGKGPINCIIIADPINTKKESAHCAVSADFFASLNDGQTIFNDRQAKRLYVQDRGQRPDHMPNQKPAPSSWSVGYAAAIAVRKQTGAIADSEGLCSLESAAVPLGRLGFVCSADGLQSSIFHSALEKLLSFTACGAEPRFALNAEATVPSVAHAFTNSVNNSLAELQVLIVDLMHGKSRLASENLSGSSAAKLLGVGVGLTPAGDDFLCGVLTALHAHRRADAADKLWSLIEPQVDAATHMISACHLQLAAKGQITAASNRILASLKQTLSDTSELSTVQIANLKTLQGCCEQVGSSSGYDFLAGLLFVQLVFAVNSAGSVLRPDEDPGRLIA